MSNFLGGNSKQNQTSSNQAYPFLQQALGGNTAFAQQGGDAISALLGGDNSGLQAFKNATGFDAQTQEGSRGITGNAAASGLLRSGGTGKALANYGNAMNNQASTNYLNQLGQLAGIGTTSAGILGSAGQQSSNQQKSKSGLGGLF